MGADNSAFLRWFMPWKTARPDMTPIGWYTLADLEASFNAGVSTASARLEAMMHDQQRKD